MGRPGKRAPTVEICNSDEPFTPLAMRQHVTGAYPIDPNLISQGVPVDDRVDFGERIHAPIEGTALPPEAQGNTQGPPPAAPAEPPPTSPSEVAPDAVIPAPADLSIEPPPAAAPSAFRTTESGPSLAAAKYNPHTGEYLGTDGLWHRQVNVASPPPQSWKDLLPQA
jgi:hypothetical protein